MNVERPAALCGLAPGREVHLDVRRDIARGDEPFARIMAAVRRLGPDQVLVLRAPFEPAPLYALLGKRGFAHWTERRAPDDVTVWFHRQPEGPGRPAAAPEAARPATNPARRLDVRGLPPPGPMLAVLKALETLGPAERLEVHHDRRPVLLYPLLDERGLRHATDEPEPGLVRILIEHRGEAT